MKLQIFLLLVLLTITWARKPYSETIGAKATKLSGAAYKITPEDVAANVCKHCTPGFQVLKIISRHDLLCFVGYEPSLQSVVVTFRGSENNQNWIRNLHFNQQIFWAPHCWFCLIHHGFYQAYRTLNHHNVLVNAINDALQKHSDADILFNGHSLGGALANIAALKFAIAHHDSSYLQLYTQGAPRVGNSRFAGYQNGKIPNHFRIIHDRDIVPHLPPKHMYYHAGTEIWYNHDMSSVKKECRGDTRRCSGNLFYKGIGSIQDHLNYGKLYRRLYG